MSKKSRMRRAAYLEEIKIKKEKKKEIEIKKEEPIKIKKEYCCGPCDNLNKYLVDETFDFTGYRLEQNGKLYSYKSKRYLKMYKSSYSYKQSCHMDNYEYHYYKLTNNYQQYTLVLEKTMGKVFENYQIEEG